MSGRRIKLAVLLSGSGTTLQNMVDRIAAGTLEASVELVIGSREGLKGIERAQKAGLRSAVVERKAFADTAAFSHDIFRRIDAVQPDLVCFAGWLCFLDIPRKYTGRVMNIHPALLPSFGGRGMYGHHVHEAVLAHGCKVSGCTDHFVDNAYDTGPIIVQRTCPIVEGDTDDALAVRVFEQEKIAYPAAITLFAQDRLKIVGRRVEILPHPEIPQ